MPICEGPTDKQTDRQTDRHLRLITKQWLEEKPRVAREGGGDVVDEGTSAATEVVVFGATSRLVQSIRRQMNK